MAGKEAGVLNTLKDSERLMDFFRDRLMFPIRNHEGDLVGFAGRLLEPKEGSPKYINTPETEVFHKGALLYGMFENGQGIKAAREAILVEGYMDVIAMADNGIPFGLAPMGTALTPTQFSLILNSGVRKLTVCLDGDAAGIRASERSIETIMEQYHPGLSIYMVTLPDGHDPDSMIKAHGADAFRAEMEKAVPLDVYIHGICSAGHRAEPGLDDRAEYLTRLAPYVEQSSGALYNVLLAKALEYSKLPREQVIELLPARAEQDTKIAWDNNTALAARWLVHDEHQQSQIAAKLSGIKLKSLGLDELSALAKQYEEGAEPTGRLHQYAQAHGGLSTTEISELRVNWQSWMKRATLDEGLKNIAENPFSESAKQTIRMALR
jgi:DNA primase